MSQSMTSLQRIFKKKSCSAFLFISVILLICYYHGYGTRIPKYYYLPKEKEPSYSHYIHLEKGQEESLDPSLVEEVNNNSKAKGLEVGVVSSKSEKLQKSTCTLKRYDSKDKQFDCYLNKFQAGEKWSAEEQSANENVLVPFSFMKEFTDFDDIISVSHSSTNSNLNIDENSLLDSHHHENVINGFEGLDSDGVGDVSHYDISLQVSYSDPKKFTLPKGYIYNLNSQFINFGAFQVERRSRVKCQDSVYNLPVTTQWDKNGYFYTTQLCQFGLSYYSRFVRSIEEFSSSANSPKEDLGDHVGHLPPEEAYLLHVASTTSTYKVSSEKKAILPEIKFDISEKKSTLFTISFPDNFDCNKHNVKGKSTTVFLKVKMINPEVTIVVKYKLRNCILNKLKDSKLTDPETNFYFHRNYPIKDKCEGEMTYIDSEFADIDLSIVLYGKGPYHRLPYNDILKYWKLASSGSSKSSKDSNELSKIHLSKAMIKSIEYISSTTPTVLTFKISETPNLEYFWQSVNFLAEMYDDQGGYQMPITRTIPGYDPLPPGWYGAMAQGHALSLLSRAYFASKNAKYFESILNVLQPFKLNSEDGGVKNTLFDHYVWYEEYPMLPNGQFVLNGFMYSLVGVFDSLLACNSDVEDVNAVSCSHTAKVLFSEGMTSLYTILPMFDNGFGSNYDLRHIFSIENVEPNRARWDYHFIHTTLLKFFMAILADDSKKKLFNEMNFTDDEIQIYLERFTAVHDRWIGYMDGKFAHNNGNN